MDILTAVLACSLYADDNLVRAIVQSTSQSNAYAVVDPLEDRDALEPSPPPRSRDEAIARLADIQARGGAPLLGLMQIPVRWAERFGRDAGDLFDPCINLSVGTAMLSDFSQQCSRLPGEPHREVRASRTQMDVLPSKDNRACIVREYADAIGVPEFAEVLSLELAHQKPFRLGDKAFEAPIFYSIARRLAVGQQPSLLLARVSRPRRRDDHL